MSNVPPDVQVFLSTPDALLASPHAGQALRFLDSHDRSHIARFRFPRDREIATASRLLQRLAVAHCAGIPPQAMADIRFSAEPGRRPSVLSPAQAKAVSFSAANTRGMVACAVSGTVLVGLDVEEIGEKLPPELVEHCCTPDERKALWRLPEHERRNAFFQLWALKESYLKARGIGLEISPHLIGFAGSWQEGSPKLQAAPSTEPYPEHWHFHTIDAGPAHASALCLRNPGEVANVSVCRAEWSGSELRPVAQE
jgi:4'-phosphopantetheinyl transferase